MKKVFLIVLVAVSLMACKKGAMNTSKTINPEFDLELLFEHDGCKVYRFYDGRYIYYTDCRGQASWSVTTSSGKNSNTTHHQVTTNE